MRLRAVLLLACAYGSACAKAGVPEDHLLFSSLLSFRYYGPKFALAGFGSPSGIASYAVSLDGRIGEVSRVTVGNFPVAMSFDSSLRFVRMSSNSGGGYVDSLSFNRDTGVLSLVQELPATGTGVVVFDHPLYSYAINVVSTQINVHPASASGTLGTAVAYDAGQSFAGGKMSSNGIFYLASNAAGGSVRSYRMDASGVVTLVQSLATGITNQAAVGLHPSGRILYVANNNATSQVGIILLDGFGGMTGPSFFTLSGGAGGTNFAFDPAGRYLFAARSIASQNLQTYAINQSSGALTLLSTATSGTGPGSIAVDSASRFLFHCDPPSNQIRVYSYNEGLLSPVTGSPFSTGTLTNPSSLALVMYEQYAFGPVQFNQ